VVSQGNVFEFDLRQFKTGFEDWEKAFQASVYKRIKYAQHGVFLGLSAGYDSGAIQVALSTLGKEHFGYSILGAEQVDIVKKRYEWAQGTGEGNLVQFSQAEFDKEFKVVQKETEPFL
jgi:hypothetical protein